MNSKQKKLRVAFATRYPYTESDSFSGLLQVSKNLCEALVQREDIDLHVISGNDKVSQLERKQINGVSVSFFPYPNDILYYGTFYLLAAQAMRREILRIQPDIIHCQAIAETPVAGILARLPLVTTIHGIAANESGIPRTLKIKLAYQVQTWVEKWYVKRLQHVFSCSPYVARFVRQHNPHAHLYDISNPMDPDFFQVKIESSQPKPHSILMVGSITPRKGHDLMVEALPHLLEIYPDLQLTVVGNEADKPFVERVKATIQERNLNRSVHWLGPVSQQQLIKQMTNHQILCLPSREDTLPMSISQAMIVGNIPIASDAGGIPEMIQDSKNGFLFAKENVEALVQTILKVLQKSPDELDKMRRQNRVYADQTYGADSIAQRTVEIYHKILETVK